MKIVIAGGTGFVGRHVNQLLNQEGHSVIVLSRQADVARPFERPTNPTHTMGRMYARTMDSGMRWRRCCH